MKVVIVVEFVKGVLMMFSPLKPLHQFLNSKPDLGIDKDLPNLGIQKVHR